MALQICSLYINITKKKLKSIQLYGVTLVKFIFPSQKEFESTPTKTFKVDRLWPIQKILANVFKRFENVNPRKFQLCTMKGKTLLGSENLSSYGLGSLYESMVLRVIPIEKEKKRRKRSIRKKKNQKKKDILFYFYIYIQHLQ